MTPERKAELRARVLGGDRLSYTKALELLDALGQRDADLLEARGNFEVAQARIAELERERDAAWDPDPDPDTCPVHDGSIHGGEAEELRAGIEKIIGDLDLDIDREAKVQLQRLLDSVDARDSLGHLERGDIVTDLRKQVADRDRSIEALTARISDLTDDLNTAVACSVCGATESPAASKRIDSMTAQIASLQHQHRADAARIAGLESAANRRLTERDARIDEVAAEAQAERSKRERVEAAAREVVSLHDDHDGEVLDCVSLPVALDALRTALGGRS